MASFARFTITITIALLLSLPVLADAADVKPDRHSDGL